MRTFTNTLIFSGFLEKIPDTAPQAVVAARNALIYPILPVTEADCGTMLGTSMQLSPASIGYLEVATGQPLTRSRITTLLQTQSSVYVRDLSSCTSPTGVCQTCFNGARFSNRTDLVNTLVAAPPSYSTGNNYRFGDGLTTTFALTYDPTQYASTSVYLGDTQVFTGFTVGSFQISFDVAPAWNEQVTVRSRLLTTDAFITLLANSYSGDVIGIQPLSSLDLPLPRRAYLELLTPGIVTNLIDYIKGMTRVPAVFINFLDKTPDVLEKILLALAIFSVFA